MISSTSREVKKRDSRRRAMRWKKNYKACIAKFKRERALLLRRHGRGCSHVTQYAAKV
jgi:hypothetical protein